MSGKEKLNPARLLLLIAALFFAAVSIGTSARAAESARELYERGQAKFYTGRYIEAETFFRQALKSARLEDLSAKDRANLLIRLGVTLRRLQSYEKSEQALRKAVEIYRTETGENSLVYSIGLTELATTLSDSDRFEEAEQLYRRVIDLDETNNRRHHKAYASALASYANLLLDLDRLEEAEVLYRRAIEIANATTGSKSPKFATTLSNFSIVLRYLNKFSEAEETSRRSLAITEEFFGTQHPTYAVRLNRYAMILFDQKQYERAEVVLRQAIDIIAKTHGDLRTYQEVMRFRIALVYLKLGRPSDSKLHLAKALEIAELELPEDDSMTKRIAWAYARVLKKHFPDDPALVELQEAFGPDIGKVKLQ